MNWKKRDNKANFWKKLLNFNICGRPHFVFILKTCFY